jgi:hypothetical protein
MIRQTQQDPATRSRAGRTVFRFFAGFAIAAALGACSVVGGIAAYKSDSSHGCRATPTKTICPK